ncbi:glycosyltransferase family 2 protein [Nostoc sp. NIES-2111]
MWNDKAAALVALGALLYGIYILVGYPLWLALSGKHWPVRRSAFEPKVDLIVAVHNGESHLEAKLESILDLDYPREKLRVLVVSDGSTDRTAEIASRYSAQGVELLETVRGGKCRALNAGLAVAAAPIVVFTDVRQCLERGSLRLLLENFADPLVGAASGALYIRRGDSQEEVATGLYWNYERWIREQLSKRDSIFGATGAYYAMRRELTAPLPEQALLDDMHLPLGAFFRGYRLILDPRARMFDEPTGIEDEFWRKVRTLAGNFQILWSYPRLLWPGWLGGNRMWVHFLSYKFGRLLLPWALLVGLCASAFLPAAWRWPVLAVEAGVCLLIWVDPWLPAGPWRKLTAALRSFASLMLATACAPFWLLAPAERRWRSTRKR